MIHCYTVDLFFLAKVLIRFVFLPSIHVDEKKRKDEPCKKFNKNRPIFLLESTRILINATRFLPAKIYVSILIWI